jgi:16S rRNA (cytidine1402-2'-O)-methyltransferase
MPAGGSKEDGRLAGMTGERDLAPGLYVVATPIGNLEDMTLRAVRVLKQADVIACEDTRQTQKLLQHYSITTQTVSYHEHNEAERAAELVEDLAKGARVALVTDAGMPGVSDPGYRLITAAIERGVTVVPVPGASAVVTALVASGLPMESFHFGGFLPAKSGRRKKALEQIRGSEFTQIFYEAPHRIVEALKDVVDALGAARRVVVARELTKLHEEVLRGTAGEVLQEVEARGEVKGEITLLIGRAEAGDIGGEIPSVRERISQIMAEEKLDEKDALKRVAKERGISKSEAYREWQRGK